MEKSFSYAINVLIQTSTETESQDIKRSTLANPLCSSSICSRHACHWGPLEATHGFILLCAGIHHTGGAAEYCTICGTAICSHGAYMKVPQLSHSGPYAALIYIPWIWN